MGATLKQVVGWIWPGQRFADSSLMAWVCELNISLARFLGMGGLGQTPCLKKGTISSIHERVAVSEKCARPGDTILQAWNVLHAVS